MLGTKWVYTLINATYSSIDTYIIVDYSLFPEINVFKKSIIPLISFKLYGSESVYIMYWIYLVSDLEL